MRLHRRLQGIAADLRPEPGNLLGPFLRRCLCNSQRGLRAVRLRLRRNITRSN